jgi:predicted MFS family arabinose efflux permease
MMQNQVQEKLWNTKFIFSCLANFFAFTTMYYLMSTIPLYTTQVLSGDKSDVGVLFALYAFAGVLARPVAGYVVDRSGRMKVAWGSLLLLFLAVFAYHWAIGLMALFVLRFVHGVFWGFSTTSLATVATDVIPAKRRGEGIGYFGLSMSIAMLIGPWMGLTLLQNFDYSGMFLFAALIAALACVCLFGIHYEEQTMNGVKKSQGLFEKKVLPYAGIVFFMAIGYSAILSFIVLFSQEINIGNASVFFLANAVGVILSRPYAGKIMDQKGPVGIMCFGFFAFFMTFICLYFTQGMVMFLISAFLLGTGFGILYSLCFVMSINAVDVTRRGMANGTILTAFDLGFAVGSMGLGAVSMMTGLRSMYLICAVIVLIPLGIFYISDMRHHGVKPNSVKENL